MIRLRARERGVALILAMTVLVFLTILGLSAMNTAGEDLTVAANMKQSENARAIAEAGIAAGMDALKAEIVAGNYTGLLSDTLNGLQNPAAKLTNGTDEICTGLPAAQCLSWRQLLNVDLSLSVGDGFNNGSYRVVYGDDVDNDAGGNNYAADNNETLILRALGTDSTGSKRLIEVVVTGN